MANLINAEILLEDLQKKYELSHSKSIDLGREIRDWKGSKASSEYRRLEIEDSKYTRLAADYWNLMQNIKSGKYDNN